MDVRYHAIHLYIHQIIPSPTSCCTNDHFCITKTSFLLPFLRILGEQNTPSNAKIKVFGTNFFCREIKVDEIREVRQSGDEKAPDSAVRPPWRKPTFTVLDVESGTLSNGGMNSDGNGSSS